MAEDEEAQVPVQVASGIEISVTPDGNHIALSFKTGDTPTSVGLPAQDLGKLISYLLSVGEQVAEEHQTKIADQETLNVKPIEVIAMGIAQGRTDHEALLSIRTGPMSLAFAVDLNLLMESLENLKKITSKSEPRKLH